MQPAVCHMPYNRAMSHLDLLIPFALPPAELAGDLFKQAEAPAFATLLSRSQVVRTANKGFKRSLPHEDWLASTFGMTSESSPAVAPAWMRAMGVGAGTGDRFDGDAGMWYVVQPIYIHIARDHLVLTDPAQLELEEEDSLALFEIARSLFHETGRKLVYGNAGTWFVRADDWPALLTSSPDAASGHNIDIWMPSGPNDRSWRKIQNEVQMHWHDHPVNAARERRGLKPVNSLWLWGGAQASDQASGQSGLSGQAAPYALVGNMQGWLSAFAASARESRPLAGAAELPTSPDGSALVVLHQLLRPALEADWGNWLAALATLETAWFEPILNKVKQGDIKKLNLILTNDSASASFALTRHSLRKFWIKPTLSPLLP
jgi:hypothetical protein